MRIRRYTGKDAQEAMLKVKMDLGNEAVILSTRKVRKKGIMGMFSKPLTEVLAAIDEDYSNKKSSSSPSAKNSSSVSGVYNRNGIMQAAASEDNSRVESLENRVKLMESMLERIYNNVSDSKKPNEEKEKPEEQHPVVQEAEQQQGMAENEYFKSIRSILSDNEIEPVIIDKMMKKVQQFVKNPGSVDEVINITEKILLNVLGEPQTIQFRDDGKPTVAIFIGPTGVGKTTTLAKIAADYSLNKDKKIGLITADTYRIAAVEQLKTYAEILNIPVSVVYTPMEVKEAISQHSDKDLILIDTAGRGHKNAAQFSELKALVAATEADEIFLVLSCGMSRLACKDIISHYRFLKKYKLLFTKLDEVLVPGVILNVRYVTGKPLSYTTAGQSVPDDIEVANVPDIVRSMLFAETKK